MSTNGRLDLAKALFPLRAHLLKPLPESSVSVERECPLRCGTRKMSGNAI